jgi:hypothetical protein
MRNSILSVALSAAVLALGCGGGVGRVKGQVVEGGKPLPVEGQVALMFELIGPDGKPDEIKSYPVPLNKDGSFELVASGGTVPPGTYRVTVQVNGRKEASGIARYKGQSLTQEVKAGSNNLTIDLAKSSP